MKRLRTTHLALHALRVAGCVALLATRTSWTEAAAVSVALTLTFFSIAHDAVHRSLGLPRRGHVVLMSTAAALMLVSGHVMRRMHLLHHARPLSDADIEGRGAKLSWFGALLEGPSTAVRLRVSAYRAAGVRERRIQLLETAIGLALVVLAVALGWMPLLVYVATTLVLQLTTAFWASYIPHHPPAAVVATCKKLAFLRSPALLSLAYHDVHHRRPDLPCQALASGDLGLRGA